MFDVKIKLQLETASSLVWRAEPGCENAEQPEMLIFCEKEVFNRLNHYANEAGGSETAFLSGHHRAVADWLFKQWDSCDISSWLWFNTTSDKWKQMAESRFNMIECVFY